MLAVQLSADYGRWGEGKWKTENDIYTLRRKRKYVPLLRFLLADST